MLRHGCPDLHQARSRMNFSGIGPASGGGLAIASPDVPSVPGPPKRLIWVFRNSDHPARADSPTAASTPAGRRAAMTSIAPQKGLRDRARTIRPCNVQADLANSGIRLAPKPIEELGEAVAQRGLDAPEDPAAVLRENGQKGPWRTSSLACTLSVSTRGGERWAGMQRMAEPNGSQ